MAARSNARKRFFVDFRVQGALVVRVVLYWLTCLFAIMLLLLGWDMFSGPTQPWNVHWRALVSHFQPAAVASLVILPAVLVDIVRLSHRFAGPMFRLRQSLHDLAQGKPVPAIRFRHGDFWQEFADDFNTVAARIVEHNSADLDLTLQIEEDELLVSSSGARHDGAA